MPARSVVIESLSKFTGEGHEDLTPSQYTQLTGRAGRRGIDPVGHALVLWSPWYGFDKVAALAASREFVLRSAFQPTYNMVVNLVRRYDRDQAHELLGRSFAQYQADASLGRIVNRRATRQQLLADATARATCELGDVDEYRGRRADERRAKREARQSARARVAAELGSDVPFFLYGGTALGTGRGERIEPLPDPAAPPLDLWLAIPPVAAKTTSTSESAASSDKIEIAAAAQTMPAAKSERVATLQDRPVAVAPTSSDRAPIDNVSNNLPKDTTPETMSPVFAPPRDAQHVAELTPDVAVAESEAEVVKLEGQIGMGEPPPESEMEIARLERAAAPSDALMPIAEDTAAMGGPYIPVSEFEATRVTRYVNLRDGPADEAKVIAVIPTNSTVQAETNCGWCAVTYKGQRGYIYKGFLSGRGGGGAKAIGGRTRVTKKLIGKPGLY